MKINDDIFLVDGAGFDSNIYVISEELLVDTGTGLLFKETIEQMESYGLNPRKIKTIILTHAHFDHCGGARLFKELTGAKIFIHQKDKEALESGNVLAEMFDAKYDPVKASPLEDKQKIKAGNYSFAAIHTPGHTPGSICLWEKSNGILISGDTLFIDGFGTTEDPRGSEADLIKSLKKIKNLRDIRILLPGHGAPASSDNIYAKDAIKKILEQID